MGAERTRPARRRRPWIAVGVVLGLVLGVRALLPWVARGALERGLADATHSRVTIGDVDLGVLRGALRLEEIAFRDVATPAQAPAAAAGGPEGAAARTTREAAGASAPWLRARSFEVRIAWTALWSRTLRVRSLVLVEPELAVARLEGGGLDLPVLRDDPEAQEEPGAAASEDAEGEDATWALAVDGAVLHDGRVRFRDATIAATGPVKLDIDQIDLEHFSLRDDAYEEPARLVADGAIEDARWRAEASLQRVPQAKTGSETGWKLDASLDAEGVPIRRVRFYLSPRYAPSRHWAELDGALDLDLDYAFTPGAEHAIEGSGALRDVHVRVEGSADAPGGEVLSWRRLGVETRSVDLRERRVDLAAVALEGARLLVHTGRDARLPLLASGGAPPEPDVAAAPAPASSGGGPGTETVAAAGPGPEAPEAGSGPDWSGSLAELRVSDATLELVDAEGTAAEWSLEASAEDLAPDADFPVRVELTREKARIAADGRLRAAPPGGAAELVLEGLPVRDLALHALGGVPPLRGGTLSGRLQLETAGADEPRLEVRGGLGVADARLEADDAEAFALGWEELAAELDRVVVPLAGDAPLRIALASLRAVAPRVRLRRTAQGFALPAFSPEGAAEPSASEGAAGNGGPPPQVRVARVEIERADVRLDDRGVEPFVRHEVTGARASARDVRWPSLRVTDLVAELPGLGEEPATLRGGIGEEGLDLDMTTTRVALPPLNPYVTSHSSYAIASGAASLRADVKVAEDVLDADLDLTLHELGLQDGGGTFRKDFGVSLPLGMALLRDVGGDIHLSLPIRRDRAGVQVNLFGTIGNALHGAILNALMSPLKIAGAVVSVGGAVETVAPQPVEYRPGEVATSPAGAAQIERLARLLASKPRLGLALRPLWTPADREALAAPPSDDAPGASEGAPSAPEDAPSGVGDAPAALARARVVELRRVLEVQHGVGGARIVSVADPAAADAGSPRIELEFAPFEPAPDDRTVAPDAPDEGADGAGGDA